jgi:two-component system response regulator FixJ
MNGRGGADHPDERSAAQRITTLTQREREVLKRLAAGQTNQAIAGDLGLSVRTVEIHRARMLDKLGVQSLAQAIRLAVLAGI